MKTTQVYYVSRKCYYMIMNNASINMCSILCTKQYRDFFKASQCLCWIIERTTHLVSYEYFEGGVLTPLHTLRGTLVFKGCMIYELNSKG